jgi:hypothetical protein
MVAQATSWLKENSTLAAFLVGQVIAIGAAAAAMIAYSVKLETRVHIMETRGAEYSVARMARMEERITILEGKIDRNAQQIERLVTQYFKDIHK